MPHWPFSARHSRSPGPLPIANRFFLAGGFCALPQQMAVLNLLPESFKSGMGLTYDQLGPEVNRGVERLLAPWFRTQLVPSALPKLDGVVGKLQTGARSQTLDAAPESH